MILTDLSNTLKKLWDKISFHKHFNDHDITFKIEWKYLEKLPASLVFHVILKVCLLNKTNEILIVLWLYEWVLFVV